MVGTTCLSKTSVRSPQWSCVTASRSALTPSDGRWRRKRSSRRPSSGCPSSRRPAAEDRSVPDQDENRFVPDQDENRSASDQVPELLDAGTLRAIERLTLVSLDAVIAGVAGPRASEMRGFALEFADYRAYAPGDDLRQLDWHVYMRLRELLVKVGPLEGRLEVDLLVDTNRSRDPVLACPLGA